MRTQRLGGAFTALDPAKIKEAAEYAAVPGAGANGNEVMTAKTDARGMRRRADKLRFISWANLLVCVGVGLFSDLGEAVLRWTVVLAWSVLLLVVCHARAAQLDRQGPVRRRERREGQERKGV